jgi:hypothetical protein
MNVNASDPAVPVLIVTGPVGAGKTSVAGEILSQLTERDVSHAVVDLDGLALCWPHGEDDPFNHRMAMANLAAVWQNFAAAGIRRLVIARVIESREELADYCRAIPGARIQVGRLAASKPTLRARVGRREAGTSLEALGRRAEELADIMANSDVADFTVHTDRRALPDIAIEVLQKAHWLDLAQTLR